MKNETVAVLLVVVLSCAIFIFHKEVTNTNHNQNLKIAVIEEKLRLILGR